MATNLEIFLEGSMAGLAVLLAVVAAASARRAGSRRAWVLALAFTAFAAKGLLLLAGTLAQDPVLSTFDLAVLALLYGSLLAG